MMMRLKMSRAIEYRLDIAEYETKAQIFVRAN
jgi:hypothetical protein